MVDQLDPGLVQIIGMVLRVRRQPHPGQANGCSPQARSSTVCGTPVTAKRRCVERSSAGNRSRVEAWAASSSRQTALTCSGSPLAKAVVQSHPRGGVIRVAQVGRHDIVQLLAHGLFQLFRAAFAAAFLLHQVAQRLVRECPNRGTCGQHSIEIDGGVIGHP